ncbi:hydroxypyruvate isomerase [Megalodesulfovibrio gigas]|uniref:Putative hydroxypyruvate isomerase n=1 Tax=Megalodesulfovibrio gigas (strain ATCC 19364 / DSM 1382 / NCIMB 9332 / VKM B-1759) TaxID=1121448 RepID=T2GDC5_MEGG1|nr:hydroxypyruvate isomerase [Megalodesulfovibrio gigas]AGW14174.1 putative hydroxypyruvate isomerase [Megalodesulfovibrio gigas DSM 1382 = ATCC 19364]
MPKFSANLSMLFTDLPFPERFTAAAEMGFSAVEYLFPYEYEPEMLRRLLTENGLMQVLFNLPAGNWADGDRGIACDPARVEEFRAGVAQAVAYAKALGTPRLNCLAGKLPANVDENQAWNALVDNLRLAAGELAKVGCTLLVEFINRKDIPGFFLHGSGQTLRLLDAVNAPNLLMQYDVYHAQREEGELTGTLRANIARIGHIQVADNPGRHQPGTGEINFPFLFNEIDRLGYQGHIGLEYVPTPDTRASLEWIHRMGLRA